MGKKKNPSSRRQQPKPKKVVQPIGITECAARYAVAIADPWSPMASGACVPTSPSRPSQKVTGWKDLIVTVGESGYGCIMLAPCLSNNAAAIWYTTSSFDSDEAQASIDAPQTGLTYANMTNLPYDYTQFVDGTDYGKPQVMGRVVSAAISAEYIGTELNRGGNVICFVDPDHHSVNNIPFREIISRAESEISSPNANRTKCWIGTNGNDDTEIDYPDTPFEKRSEDDGWLQAAILATNYPFSKGIPLAPTGEVDIQAGTPIMIIIFTGVKGNQFRCKVVEHVEYIGVKADIAATPNMTDAKGFELVQAASTLMYKRKASRPGVPLRTIMKECLNESWRALTSPAALKAGAALLSSL